MQPSLALRLGLVLSSLLTFAFAQEPADSPNADASDNPFGHSFHGEVFNEGPRQAAVLIPGTGNVHFEVSTESEEAQTFFDQGIGQLHGFWDFEAERTFRQVAAIDPKCAMAYWGMAMANFGNDKRARGFIAEATERREGASKREQMFIDSLATYFKEPKDGKPDSKTRLRTLVRDLEKIVVAYPEDIEAKAFLMKQIYYNNGRGNPIPSHLAVNAFAADILEAQPDHPAHHYRIHLWDKERAELALDSAAECGPAAPGIAHMWHMPGHIYSKLHRYEDAAWQQEASARIDHAHMTRFMLIPDQIHNFAHNNEWLIRNLNYLGKAKDGAALARNMIELPRLPKFEGDTENYSHSRGSWSYGRQRLRDVLMAAEQWELLLEMGRSDYLQPAKDQITELEWNRFMAVAAYELGDTKLASEYAGFVGPHLAGIENEQSVAVAKAKEKAADKPEAEQKKAAEAAKKPFRSKIDTAKKVQAELKAYELIAKAQGGNEEEMKAAAKAIEDAKGIERLRKARLLLDLGKTDRAVTLATEEVKSSPGQVYPLALQVAALWRADQNEDAKTAFEKLRTLAADSDPGLACIDRLQPLIAGLELDGGWRTPAEPAKDLGHRPPLDELGPVHWQPPVAPAFTLPDADGKPVALSDYRGKPVVVIFYLGRGCVHCMEQLNEFAPYQERFAEAGIELLAVSTDTTEGLRRTYAFASDDDEEKNPFPFPLLSDPELNAFKDYRAFDDFEDMPLHGTYLIDGKGRIRWLDISYEPFMHPGFMLEESVRLLGIGES